MALWAVPVLALTLALPALIDREEASVAPPLPAVVAVGSETTDYKTSVSVSIATEDAGQVRSPIAGLLTATNITDQVPATSGQTLFAVDGVPVLAHVGQTPFYRDLREGMRSADVLELAHFLASAGLMDDDFVDDRFGSGVREAVRNLQADIGVKPDGVFRPTYVTFIPEGVVTIDGDALLPLGSILSAGDAIYDLTPTPAALEFTPTSRTASLSNLRESPLILAAGGASLTISSIDVPINEVQSVYNSLEAAGALSQTAGPSSDDDGEASRSAITLDGAFLSLAEPPTQGVAPSTAVYITRQGTQCLFEVTDTERIARPLAPSSATTAGLGTVYVDERFIGAQVIRDPSTLSGDLLSTCQ